MSGGKEPEAVLWHTERETGRNLYHITIVDNGEKIDLIVKYRTSDKYLESEPYMVHEMDYTVHDVCSHEDDYCVLEDPHSAEYLEIEIETRRNIAHSELDKRGINE